MTDEPEKIIDAEVNGSDHAPPQDSPREGLVLAAELLPGELPVLPLRPRPAFPGLLIPMIANGPLQMAAVKQAMESPTQAIGLILVKHLEEEDSPHNLHRVGVAGKILKLLHQEEESVHFLVNCLERFTCEEVQRHDAHLSARVHYRYGAELSVNPELKAYSMAIIGTLKELVQINPLYSEEIKMFLGRSSMDDPGRLPTSPPT